MQYLVRNAKMRRFVDAIVVASWEIRNRPEFSESLNPTLWRKRIELCKKLFNWIKSIGSEYYEVTNFLFECYSLRSKEADSGLKFQDAYKSRKEETSTKGSLVVLH